MEVEEDTMPKQLNFRLDDRGRKTIETAMKTDPRQAGRQRVITLRLLNRGHSPKQFAELLAASVASVYTRLHRWEADGLEGLANRPRQTSRLRRSLCRLGVRTPA